MPLTNCNAFRSAALSAVALALTSTCAMAQESFPAATTAVKPTADAFYVSPPASQLANVELGTILRYRTAPSTAYGSLVSGTYQVMFRTSDTQGHPTAAITTILVPKNAPATDRKLLSYQAFYDSLTINCTASYLTARGALFEEGNVDTALRGGNVVILTDYEGLDSQWIAGLNTAHGVLDGIRAAQRFKEAGLSPSTPVAMMGFSGGGHATAWAAEVAPEYAPELKIVGAAMGGIPVNPLNVAKKVDGGLFSGVFFGASIGEMRAYKDRLNMQDYLTDAGKRMSADIANRCFLGGAEGQPEMLMKYAFQKGSKFFKPGYLESPVVQAINTENTLGSRMPKTPVYVYEATTDEIMPIADVDALVKRYCDAGVKVQYHRVLGSSHLVLALGSSGGMNFVLNALEGKTPPSNCK
jgi:acetyl esterase/lipase